MFERGTVCALFINTFSGNPLGGRIKWLQLSHHSIVVKCQICFHCIINHGAVFWHLMRFQTRGSITHTGPSCIIFNHLEQHTSTRTQLLVCFFVFFSSIRPAGPSFISLCTNNTITQFKTVRYVHQCLIQHACNTLQSFVLTCGEKICSRHCETVTFTMSWVTELPRWVQAPERLG